MSTRPSAARAAAAAATRHRCPAHAAGGLGRQAGGGEDGQQPPGAHVAVGATRRRIGIGHGPALVEDGMTGRTAEFVNGHVVNLRCGSLREHTGCDEFVAALAALAALCGCACNCSWAAPRLETGRAKAPARCLFEMRRPCIGRRVLPGAEAGGLPAGAAPSGCARRWPLALVARPSRWLRRRLWKPQSRRPLSWVASHPRRRSRCGRPGRSRRARSNGGGCRCGRAARWPFSSPGEQPGPHADVDPVAQREQGPLEVGRVHPRRRGPTGASTVPFSSSQMRPCIVS